MIGFSMHFHLVSTSGNAEHLEASFMEALFNKARMDGKQKNWQSLVTQLAQ
jgi:hypothetical protein